MFFPSAHKLSSSLRWINSVTSWIEIAESNLLSTARFFHINGNPKFYSKRSVGGRNAIVAEAEKTLIDYLHCTRGLSFQDADHIGRNSPRFLRQILDEVKPPHDVEGISDALDRFLRYNPINEFEPFFESLGLEPSEYVDFVPRDLMFLADDELLLQNYNVLCKFGIVPNKIGKILKKVRGILHYDSGVLLSKLRDYESFGLNWSLVGKVIASCPSLLTNVNDTFVEVMKELNEVGIDSMWVENHLMEDNLYDWNRILGIISLLRNVGCSKEQLLSLIQLHPELIFENSGGTTFMLFVFQLKVGSTASGICSLFCSFPQVDVGSVLCNMRRCYDFLLDIEMTEEDISTIFRYHSPLLGLYSLKKASFSTSCLNSGKGRIRESVRRDPEILTKCVVGSKPVRFKEEKAAPMSHEETMKFLLRFGLEENSLEMKRALQVFRNRALMDRVDCFLKSGFDQSSVNEIVRAAPHVLKLSKKTIEMKIDFLLNNLGFKMSTLTSCPWILSYSIERIQLRVLMYHRLKDDRAIDKDASLSTIVGCDENYFIKFYVSRHPDGIMLWDEFKKQICSN